MSFFNRGGGRSGGDNPGNKPTCRFFLEGRCRYGDACHNYHPPRDGQSSNQSRGGQSLPYSINRDHIKGDFTIGEDRPSWPLSAYGPGKDAPRQLLEGTLEQSPEELRVLYYLAKAGGSTQQYEQNEASAIAEAGQRAQQILSDLDGAVKYVVDGKDMHPNREDEVLKPSVNFNWTERPTLKQNATQSSGTGTAFGQPSNFGGSSAPAPAFGQPSSGGSAFGGGQQTGGSAGFGKPSPLGGGASTAFGAPSALGGSSSAFGKPSALGGGSAFGAQNSANSSPFGQTNSNSGGSTFGQASSNTGSTPFGQAASNTGSTPFGQAASNTGSTPFGQAASGGSAFGQPSAPGAGGAFGKPSAFGAAASSTTTAAPAFGQSSFGSKPAGSSPFAQASQPAQQQSSAFGQPSQPGQQSSAFGQPSQPGQQSAFGQPSQPGQQQQSAFGKPSPFSNNGGGASSTAPAFGQSSFGSSPSPFGAAASDNTTSAFGQQSQQQQKSAFGSTGGNQQNPFATQQQQQQPTSTPGAPLTTFHNQPVTYQPDPQTTKPIPHYTNPRTGKPERIWHPEGAPGPNPDVEAADPQQTYEVLGAALKQVYDYVREQGSFKDGVVPEIPPKREWVGWDL